MFYITRKGKTPLIKPPVFYMKLRFTPYFFHANSFFAYFFYDDSRVIPRLRGPFRFFALILFHANNRSHSEMCAPLGVNGVAICFLHTFPLRSQIDCQSQERRGTELHSTRLVAFAGVNDHPPAAFPNREV